MGSEKRILFQAEEIQRMIGRVAHEILEKNGGTDDLALMGIRSRGAYLAARIAAKIEQLKGSAVPARSIDVTPYRDDVSEIDKTESPPPIDVPLSLESKTVVLIDDVIYTGRTIRAALDLLARLEKPKRVLVAILVDRGARELPIKADIVGKNVQVAAFERINVLLQEVDGIDQVVVARNERPMPGGRIPG